MPSSPPTLALEEAMLSVWNHLSVLHLPQHRFQKDLLHDLPRHRVEADRSEVPKMLLSILFRDRYKSGPSQIPDTGNISDSRCSVSRGKVFLLISFLLYALKNENQSLFYNSCQYFLKWSFVSSKTVSVGCVYVHTYMREFYRNRSSRAFYFVSVAMQLLNVKIHTSKFLIL